MKNLEFFGRKNMQKFDKKDQREEASARHHTVFENYIKKSHLIV